MLIRTATPEDGEAITSLLSELGYAETQPFIHNRITQILTHSEALLMVAEVDGQVVGILSLHFIPQLALARDFCRISYFCVSQPFQRLGIGQALETFAAARARARGCDLIEVHCHSRRLEAHQFYYQQGYQESPKYLIKRL